MTEHTQEPWRLEINDNGISYIGGHNYEIAVWHDHDDDQLDANARRIVACVNACVGIETERLEALGPGRLASMIDEYSS